MTNQLREVVADALLPCPFCGESNLDQWPNETLDASGANCVRCPWCHGAAPMKTWNRRTLTQQQGGEQEAGEERWVVVRESVLDVGLGDDVRTGGKPELGYALIANAGTFESQDAARLAHRAANLPLGWVVMSLSQLLPDLCLTTIRSKQAAPSEGDVAKFVRDLAENGLRYGLDPCHDWTSKETIFAFWRSYMSQADKSIRDRAAAALQAANTSKQAAGEAVLAHEPMVPRKDMKRLYNAYVRLLESGRDRIRDLGGECDGVDVMERNDLDLRHARDVLTTPPRHPADEGAVDDSMVERAADAYEAAAESEGFGRVEGSERVTHLRFIRAAIDAALQAGIP